MILQVRFVQVGKRSAHGHLDSMVNLEGMTKGDCEVVMV